MPPFNPLAVRRDFPILSLRVNGHPLVYFDNAATTQKPRAVLDKISQFYKHTNANVHRGSHALSNTATHQFEQARETVAQFINAPSSNEIIWCKGTTEAINLVANSLGNQILEPGDSILVSTSEHHANIVPWQLIAQKTGAQVIAIKLTDTQRIDQVHYQQLLAQHQPKIVALGHVSNALGIIHPIKEMIAQAQEIGAVTLIDGAQAIAHLPIDVQQLGCDFYCFSGHKCYGPTGIGVLWGKEALLNSMPPWQGGGEMIKKVSFTQTLFNELPFKFEAGTPPIAQVIALAAAIDYLMALPRSQVHEYEQMLSEKLHQACSDIPQVTCYSTAQDNVGIVSFCVDTIHHQDLALLLDQSGIALRSGHHCAMPLMESLNISGTLRASISFYNTVQEIDFFADALQQAITLLSSDTAAVDSQHSNNELSNPTFPLSQTIKETLISASTWQQRFSYLMSLGTLLPKPSEHLLQDCYKLAGCESGVWLAPAGNEQAHYQAWSDARIMRGLLVMLLSCKEEVMPDYRAFLEDVKLSQYLSSSRTHALSEIIKILSDS